MDAFPKLTAEEAAEVVSDGALVACSGFTAAGCPKLIPSALAKRAERLHAEGKPFQSPSCLLKCQRPKNFCSVSWNKMVNSCSFASGKQPLETLDYNGLISSLDKVEWSSCMKR